MARSLTFALETNAWAGGKRRSSCEKVSIAAVVSVDMPTSSPGCGASMRLKSAAGASLDGREVGVVVVVQGQEPAECVQITVVRMPGGGAHVRRGWELRRQGADRLGRLRGEALDAVPRDGGGGRARLAGGARRLAPRQPERDGRDAAFDEQQVHRDLAEAPVVGGPGAEVRIARAAYSLQQLASPSVR